MSLNNTLSFLFFHNVHIKQREATFQAFSFLLLTKAPCQVIKFLLIEECRTHCTSKREKSKLHNIVAFLQKSKKANSHGSPRSPNNAPRKRFTRGICEGAIERSNKKRSHSCYSSNSRHPPHHHAKPKDGLSGASPPPLPFPNL